MRWAKDGPVSVGAGPGGPDGEEVGTAGRDDLPEGCRDVAVEEIVQYHAQPLSRSSSGNKRRLSGREGGDELIADLRLTPLGDDHE